MSCWFSWCLRLGSAPTKRLPLPGPNIQESGGKRKAHGHSGVFDTNAHDEALFDYYALFNWLPPPSTSSPADHIIGKPRNIRHVSPWPDGKHILIRASRPYSYVLPLLQLPREIEVWDRAGQMVYKDRLFRLGIKSR